MQKAFSESYKLEQDGEYAEAINVLKDVYNQDSYEINLRLGWLHYLSGLFNESTPYYQRCIQLIPLSIEARFGIVNPAAAMGNWTQVENTYNDILAMDSENYTANYRLGLIYYGKGDYKTAAKYFEKLLNHYPFDYDSIIMSAWTYFKMGEMRKAKVLFNKALLNQPNNKSAVEGLSLIQ
ncbi:MAG: tetratricopeptide repeat protein [Bacteroidales bacterium]|nr:tetratricopeptide repeat protein [Bacteroidales bacterium]